MEAVVAAVRDAGHQVLDKRNPQFMQIVGTTTTVTDQRFQNDAKLAHILWGEVREHTVGPDLLFLLRRT